MLVTVFSFVLSALFTHHALAAPSLENRAGLKTLSPSTISSFKPFTQFARAAYCNPSVIKNWSCGGACNAIPGFVTYANGGNGGDIPFWFVGYWPAQNAAVVAHSGTDPFNLQSLLVDANFVWDSLNPTLFPGISPSIQVHDGFSNAQEATAPAILSAVQKVKADHGINKVFLTGHSLGGAIANIDAIFLKLHIPSLSIKIVNYGQPRVGNQAFADYMDANFPDITRINNNSDPIPIVPGRFLGFHHTKGEIHIQNRNWVTCTGQDNTDGSCSTGAVKNIFEGNILNHLGDYDQLFMGTIFCF